MDQSVRIRSTPGHGHVCKINRVTFILHDSGPLRNSPREQWRTSFHSPILSGFSVPDIDVTSRHTLGGDKRMYRAVTNAAGPDSIKGVHKTV